MLVRDEKEGREGEGVKRWLRFCKRGPDFKHGSAGLRHFHENHRVDSAIRVRPRDEM